MYVKAKNKKEFDEIVKRDFGRYSAHVTYENGKKIYIYTALAKRNTPASKVAMSSPYWKDKRKPKRVHIASWIPNKGAGYIFLDSFKWLKNKPKKKR